MSDTFATAAAKIRAQLSAAPQRRSFRKTRDTLLEIAVSLECAKKALADLEAENESLRLLLGAAVNGPWHPHMLDEARALVGGQP